MNQPKTVLNIKIDEFTSPLTITATADTTIKEIHDLMRENKIRHIPIINSESTPVGLVSDRDIKLFQSLDKDGKLLAKHIMTSDLFVTDADSTIDKIAFEMSDRKIGSALVKNSDGSYGIFTSTDALNALVDILRGDVS